MLLYSHSLLGHSSHPKHISVLFAGLSFLFTPFELPHSAPGHLPAWVLTPHGLWHPVQGCSFFPVGHSSDACCTWYPTLSPSSSLLDALLTLCCDTTHCSLPHPAVRRHPTVAHWVFPGCPCHRHIVLGRKGEGEGVLEIILISKFPFIFWRGEGRRLFFLNMTPNFAFWKYSHRTFWNFF